MNFKERIINLNKYLLSINIDKSRHLSELIKVAGRQGAIMKDFEFSRPMADIFQEMFGHNSYTLAKWFKEVYSTRGARWNDWRANISYSEDENLLSLSNAYEIYSMLPKLDTKEERIDAIRNSEDIEYLGLHWHADDVQPGQEYSDKPLDPPNKNLEDDNVADFSLRMTKAMKDSMKNLMKIFFGYDLIDDIVSGKVTSINAYKKMSYVDARKKYYEHKIPDTEPIMSFDDGWKWVDFEGKCDIIGSLMSNCGSIGLMEGESPETTSLLGLLDEKNKPHVVVTYVGKRNEIKYPEGKGSTGPKEEYWKYIRALVEHLGANINKIEKSKLLESYLEGEILEAPEKIESEDEEANFFKPYKFQDRDGVWWVTNTIGFTNDKILLEDYMGLPDKEKRMVFNLPKYKHLLKPIKESVRKMNYER